MTNKRIANRFKRGSGVFNCGWCKRATRDTGGDNTGAELCVECYEAAGIENEISDNPDMSRDTLARLENELRAVQMRCIAKGGKLATSKA